MRIVDENSFQMIYRQSIDNCLADAIGPTGLDRAVYMAALARTAPARDQLRDWRQSGGLPFLGLPDARADLEVRKQIAER